MKVVAYCRVYTDEQACSGFSVPQQEEALRAWCSERGHELVEVVRDKDHSGAAHTDAPKGRKANFYYDCPRKVEEEWRRACPNRNHRAKDLEERVRNFALHLIENPDTLREQVEQQAEAKRERKPWLRDAREAASASPSWS